MKTYSIEVEFSGYSRGVATATVKAESESHARELIESDVVEFSEMTMRDDREYDYDYARVKETKPL